MDGSCTYIIQHNGNENTQTHQVKDITLIENHIFLTNSNGNVQQLEGRINNQILGVKGLNKKIRGLFGRKLKQILRLAKRDAGKDGREEKQLLRMQVQFMHMCQQADQLNVSYLSQLQIWGIDQQLQENFKYLQNNCQCLLLFLCPILWPHNKAPQPHVPLHHLYL